MRQSILAAKYDSGPLMERKKLEGSRQIMTKGGVSCLWVMLGFQLSFINANEFLSFARFLSKTVVSDPVKPCRKAGLAAEAAKVLVGAQECLLGKIICQGDVAPDKLTEHASHTRLMISHQLAKSVMVVINKYTSDKVCIR
jgi:hypothetical protein